MDDSLSCDEERIRHQFDRLCCLCLKNEAIDYFRYLSRRKKHEITFADLPVGMIESFCTLDEYEIEYHKFRVFGYDVVVKDTLIAEALQSLTEKKRNVVLSSYYLEMSDTEIARAMHLVCSTIHEHRTQSLKSMKKFIEEKTNGKKE